MVERYKETNEIGSSSVMEMNQLSDWDKYLDSETPVIFQAGATWCRPCKDLRRKVQETSGNYVGKVQYVHMDVD